LLVFVVQTSIKVPQKPLIWLGFIFVFCSSSFTRWKTKGSSLLELKCILHPYWQLLYMEN